MADYEYIGRGGPDGMIVAKSSSEKLGFYGTTPVDQAASASEAAVTATALTTIDGTNTTEMAALVSAVNELKVLTNQIRTDLVALGLIKGSS